MPPIVPTARTTLKRRPQRGSHERELIHAILDEGLVCHVAFNLEGQPVVLPTTYARIGGWLYLHGSPMSQMLRSLAGGLPTCVNVTLLDGLVLARSALKHSMNYRSVVLFGVAREVTDEGQKREALAALVEHVLAGRMQEARAPTPEEVAATCVLALPIQEASAKVRAGPPEDLERDLGRPCWAGVLPLTLSPGEPVREERVAPGVPVPEAVRRYRRR